MAGHSACLNLVQSSCISRKKVASSFLTTGRGAISCCRGVFQISSIGPMFGQVGFFNKFAGRVLTTDKRPRDRYVNESRRLLKVLDQRLDPTYVPEDELPASITLKAPPRGT